MRKGVLELLLLLLLLSDDEEEETEEEKKRVLVVVVVVVGGRGCAARAMHEGDAVVGEEMRPRRRREVRVDAMMVPAAALC